MSTPEKTGEEVEELKAYLLEELRTSTLRRRIYAGVRFHLRQRPWFVVLIPLVIIAELALPIDSKPVLDATTGGLLATLALILTSLTLLRTQYGILPGEIRRLNDTATELQSNAEQVRTTLLAKYPEDKGVQSALSTSFSPPPEAQTEYDLPSLLAYAYDLHKYNSNILFLALSKGGGNENLDMHALWEKGLNFITKISASTGFLSLVAAPIDFLTISAPTAIFSGIAILALGSGISQFHWMWLGFVLNVVYWTFLLATIIEVALIVRRAVRFVISGTFEGPATKKPKSI